MNTTATAIHLALSSRNESAAPISVSVGSPRALQPSITILQMATFSKLLLSERPALNLRLEITNPSKMSADIPFKSPPPAVLALALPAQLPRSPHYCSQCRRVFPTISQDHKHYIRYPTATNMTSAELPRPVSIHFPTRRALSCGLPFQRPRNSQLRPGRTRRPGVGG